MKNVIKYMVILFLIGIIASSKPVYGQSATGQLETLSGQKINSSSSSAANLNNEVVGALWGGILNSLFRSSPSPSQTEIEAKQKADLEARQRAAELAAELAAENERKAQEKHENMMEDYKILDGSKDPSYKGLDDEKKRTASIKYNCKITSFKGSVTVLRSDGKARKLSADQSLDLALGDRIYTDHGSQLKLHYEFENGGKDIIIGQHSSVNILTNEEGTQVPALIRGNIYATNSIVDDMSFKINEELIPKLEKRLKRLEIRTPSAVTSVRGTTFSISQDSISGTTLVVTDGIVDLTGLLMQQTITINAGYKGIVTPSGEILGPFKIEESEIEKWWEME
jgi:hypothetical protein